jgi:hypothetical protein
LEGRVVHLAGVKHAVAGRRLLRLLAAWDSWRHPRRPGRLLGCPWLWEWGSGRRLCRRGTTCVAWRCRAALLPSVCAAISTRLAAALLLLLLLLLL